MNIAALISGGVDSAVAVHLLCEQGYKPDLFYIKIGMDTDDGLTCTAEEDIELASATARKYGLSFHIVDLQQAYWDNVVAYTVDRMRRGLTPNPDVMCNKLIKFGCFDREAGQGYDKIATGHYASTLDIDGYTWLATAKDPVKDQTDFLAQIDYLQVSRLIFPLGGFLKEEVRDMALKASLPSARRKDSQGICFIGQVKMSDFLRHYLPDKPGKIVDTEGRTLGTHNGLHLFTMGQRKGHGVASPREGVAYVVVGKDVQRNRLILGYEDASTRGLYASRAVVGGISNTLAPLPARVMAQPRYRAKAEWASCEYLEEGKVRLGFDTPLRALAVGQVCAFYDGGKLLGGGFFESIEP